MQGLLGEALQPLAAAAAAEQAASAFDSDSNDDDVSLLCALALPVAKLQSLLTGIAMTHARALMHRAPQVGAFASQLKVFALLHHFQLNWKANLSPRLQSSTELAQVSPNAYAVNVIAHTRLCMLDSET